LSFECAEVWIVMTDSRVCSRKNGFGSNGMGVKTKSPLSNRLGYYNAKPIFLEVILKA
jgi:hypothetical protein